MQNATLSPIPLLQRSFQLLASLYTPLLILLSFPTLLIALLIQILPAPAGQILNLLYGLVAAPILVAAAFLLLDQYLKQRSFQLGSSLNRAISKAVPLVLGNFLASLVIFLGSLFLIIPGIYLGIKLAFVVCAIALEDQGALGGFGYSWNLVKGRWWGVFWAFLVLSLIVGLPLLILSLIVGISVAIWNSRLIGAGVIGAIGAAVLPIFYTFIMLLFRSLQEIQRRRA